MTAKIAFCNDLDFGNWQCYKEVQRIFSEDFGIPVQDSFWLFDPRGSELALFKRNITEKGPYHEALLQEITEDKLAILHSAGNYSISNTTSRPRRDLIEQGLDYLAKYAKVPSIWTNHGDEGDIQNIATNQRTYQAGDLPQSDTYILDLLLNHGIKFFWTDYHYSNDHFVFSLDGIGAPPLVVRETTQAGFKIDCFYRFRGHLPKAPDAQTLGRQITRQRIDQLVEASGCTIIYQHWFVHRDDAGKPFTATSPIFPKESLEALDYLASLRDAGKLQVLPLSQLLGQCKATNGRI